MAASVTLFLAGDVMCGRGIDQILPSPGDPELFEAWVGSAREYVGLAERAHGRIARPAPASYPWGDALAELDRVAPDARIVNLETAVTARGEPRPDKGIHYRMHPGNLPFLSAAKLDCCVLANNHVLDWGSQGLLDTLDGLHGAGVRTAGAGRTQEEAEAPAVIDLPGKGRVRVFAFATRDCGVPRDWAAAPARPGVALLSDLSAATADRIAARAADGARDGDLVVASIHWGGNWGYRVDPEQRAFARRLIDSGSVHAVHGHSSHHPKGIELHRGRPILYGCGDFVNDYEGIRGHEEYRADLGFMAFPTFDLASASLTRFSLLPTRICRLRVNRAGADDAAWLARALDRESRVFGTRVDAADGELLVRGG